MGEGSLHKVAVAVGAGGRAATAWQGCCQAPRRVVHQYKDLYKHLQHLLAEQCGNLLPLMCLGGKWGTHETLHPADLQVVERPGPGLSRWEKELGATEDRGTKLNPHLQSYSAFYLPVTEFDHLLCSSSPLPSTTLLQLRATAM